MEFKFKLLEEDLYALDVSNTAFARGQSPYGPSPLSGPSCEMRAFPMERKGPHRLSPFHPREGGRGSGGPEDPLDHQISNERRESSSDIVTDPHRAPADTGPLSSPWEPEGKRMIRSPTQPHSDPPSLLQKKDGYYSNYGRPSEPGEPSPIQCKMSIHGGIFLLILHQELNFSPLLPHSEKRSEFTSGLIPPSNETSIEHPEPQHES
ncbi:cTAGE family member 5 [Sciurus carolinensis]|uniref:CTAGE family member 5 n=1 Tax=Sciurus carolinensis TaxID=30640 RepID=A0AA41MKC4_SCICA|nr:cTAGE family member 5 [Sciurus carolinensis]